MNVRVTLTLLLTVSLPVLAADAISQDHASVQGRAVTRLIVRMSRAKKVPDLAAAYARANTLDGDNPVVHEAYMKRLLELGRPDIAVYPARTLLRLDPGHVGAWVVTSYLRGRKGELPDSLEAAIRAASELKPAELGDRKPLLQTLGQLLAWYDEQDIRPELPDKARRWLHDFRGKLEARPVFADAYVRVRRAYGDMEARTARFRKQLPDAREAVKTKRQEYEAMEARYAVIMAEIEVRQNLIERLRKQRYSYHYGYYHGHYGPVYRVVRPDVVDRILEEEIAVEKLKAEAAELRVWGRVVKEELDRLTERLNGIQASIDEAFRIVKQEFHWDPPVVGGPALAAAASRPSGAADSDEAAGDPESDASARLRVARLYIRHEMESKARDELVYILENYEKTRAALLARELLGRLSDAP